MILKDTEKESYGERKGTNRDWEEKREVLSVRAKLKLKVMLVEINELNEYEKCLIKA